MTDEPGTQHDGPSARARVWIRLLVSPILIAIVLGVLWLHDSTGRWLSSDLLLLVLGAAGAFELGRLLLPAGERAGLAIATLASGLLAGVGLFAPEDAAARMEARILLLTLGLFLVLAVHLRHTRPEAVDRIARTFVPVLYVGLLFSWSREAAPGEHPARVLVWVVMTAKASDMGGWLVGKPFGRHKMIPSVSPGKSWEGLAGGLFLSAVFAVVLPRLLGLPEASWSVWRLALFGLVIGGASVLAGITWSGWKRRLGAKDSSALLPEIGGVMDMIDSMLLAGPAAWAWFRLGL